MSGPYFDEIWDLDHDPDLAEALGNLLIVWSAAESRLTWVVSVACEMEINRATDMYHRIPTFDSRTKVIQALLANWETKKYKPAEIAKVVTRLSRLSKTRNEWVHGSWMKQEDQDLTGVVQRARGPAFSLNPLGWRGGEMVRSTLQGHGDQDHARRVALPQTWRPVVRTYVT